MKQMKEELWIKKSDTQDLISKFLSQLDLTSRIRGHIKIEISKFENEKSSIKVALKSVSKLEPRPKKSSLDFSLSLSIQPKNSNHQKYQTPIFKNKTDYFFDLSEDGDLTEQKFIFSQFEQEKSILQIILYDHSITRTNKLFRGIFLLPLTNLEESIYSGQFHEIPIICENNINWAIWEELKSRNRSTIATKFVENIKCFMYETRKPDFKQ